MSNLLLREKLHRILVEAVRNDEITSDECLKILRIWDFSSNIIRFVKREWRE